MDSDWKLRYIKTAQWRLRCNLYLEDKINYQSVQYLWNMIL